MGGMTSRMAGRGLALAATDLPARVQQTNIKPSPTPHLGKGGRGGRGNGMQKIKGLEDSEKGRKERGERKSFKVVEIQKEGKTALTVPVSLWQSMLNVMICIMGLLGNK